ncbi:hypothetical protein PFTANZ_05100 [Plasmodium falciparum Tanzania (2000708)]|uniref:Uncharacterized protein n=1 Tax=Plasmodium falciparum Tanzania (2000708) TaxID=1036725 RepID=A0A024W0D5_PLAFA|nr:hypothetical protein PFTANZ_05100 [Plasmodium falciparum Tanzania (2000708)]
MSGAAIGVENRCLMKNKNNKNNSCEQVNVDINYIIKDIYGYKNCKKRCIQFIEDDTICNDDIDLRKMKNKKIKVENMWYKRYDSNDMNNNNNNDNDNNDNDNNNNNNDNNNDDESQHNNSNNNDVDNNTFKRYNNYNEKYEENDNMEKEVYHTCSIQSPERSAVHNNNNNNNNNSNNYYYMTYQMNDEHIKNSNNIKIHNNVNINMSSNNVDNNDDANSIDSNDDSNNMDNSNDTHNVNNKDDTNNKYNHVNHNYYHKKRNKQQPILSSNETEDKYVLLSKKTESLMDTILFNIHSCSELNQAKKIMLPLLNDFIQNNFYKYIKFYEDNKNSSKHNVQTLQKEKKVLISAVKIQYQKILQLQKLIENQKSDIKKKTEELNQIKAKVHQYFYDINNPNKRIFSILSPDVY